MINRRLLAALAIGVPGTGLISPAKAQIVAKSRLKVIQETNTLRVGTTGDFNPMSFRTPGSHDYEGHKIDCANLLAADLGVKPVFVATDWKSLISGLTADQYDIVMTGTSMSAARAIAATFVDSWGRNAFIPLVRKNEPRSTLAGRIWTRVASR